jgi:hypothetical protein
LLRFRLEKFALFYFGRIKANMVNRFDDAPIWSGISHTKHFDVALLPVWLKLG